MTSKDFCTWLAGFFEACGEKEITADQLKTIKTKLSSVFIHEIDPSFGDAQEILNEIHQGFNNSTIFRC